MPYRNHFKKDKVLKLLMRQQGFYKLEPRKNVCLRLCASIISQQLSTKVAAVIYDRFLTVLKKKNPKPADILALDHEVLRSIGLSNSKAVYIKNVCHFFLENKLTDARLNRMSNEELLTLLTRIKGVGQWTVEMILMFTLARQDVFSAGDLGLQKAMIRLYDIEYTNTKELTQKIIEISNDWKPYRTYACRYLWEYLDSPLVPVSKT
ncbi:DNA-3-methyladenine glycosylase [Niabella terrae]